MKELIELIKEVDKETLDGIIYDCNTVDEVIMAIKAEIEVREEEQAHEEASK